MAEPTDSGEHGSLAPHAPPKPVAVALTACLVALLIDAALESWMAGSTARWWIAGVTAAYLAAVAACRRRVDAGIAGAATSLVFLGLLTTSAWFPDGQFHGLVALRQSSSTLMSALTGLTIAMGVIALLRLAHLPRSVKVAVLILGAYAVGAWLIGAVSGTPYIEVLHGSGVWRRLPFWLRGAVIGGVLLLPAGFLAQLVTAVRRDAGPWRWQQTIASAVMLVMIGTSVTSTPGGDSVVAALTAPLSAPASRPPDQAALNDQLERSLRAIEDGERESPRDRWDPAYVVEQVGKNPETLFAWVRDNTFWIPYRGLLRGPVGVLMDRQGSSLDRAVLLAALLETAGHSVRLARGQLTSHDAGVLLPGLIVDRLMKSTRQQDQPVSDLWAVAERLDAVAGLYKLDAARITRGVFEQVKRQRAIGRHLEQRSSTQAQRLQQLLQRQPTSRALSDRLQQAADVLQDHWWVQRHDGDVWANLDLLDRIGGRSEHAPPAETFSLDSLPREYSHELSLSVIAEQWADGSLIEKPVLQHVLRPSAIIGEPVKLTFIPTDWPEAPVGPEKLADSALAQHEWVPILTIGSRLVVQFGLRQDGELNPKPDLDRLARTGRRSAESVQSAVDAFGGGPDPAASQSDRRQLTAVWLEYELRAPGDPPRLVRRELFDLVGPARRHADARLEINLDQPQKVRRSLALLTETSILPLVGRLAPEFLVHVAAKSLLGARGSLSALVERRVNDRSAEFFEVAQMLAAMPGPLHLLALARFDRSPDRDRTFVDRLNILTRHVLVGGNSSPARIVQANDIVANEIGVDVTVPDPFSVRLSQGVLDTNAETLLEPEPRDAANTAEAFESAGPWVALSSAADLNRTDVELSIEMRARIGRELAAGYTVVVRRPDRVAGVAPDAGWWRLDTARGDTLGVGRNGWGTALTERALLGACWIGAMTYAMCAAGGNNDAGSCLNGAAQTAVLIAAAAFADLNPQPANASGPAVPAPPGGSPAPRGNKASGPPADPGPTQRSPENPGIGPNVRGNPRPTPPYNNPNEWSQEVTRRRAEYNDAVRKQLEAVQERLNKPIPRGPETPEEQARLDALEQDTAQAFHRLHQAERNLSFAQQQAAKRPPGDTQPSGSPPPNPPPQGRGSAGCPPTCGEFDKTLPQPADPLGKTEPQTPAQKTQAGLGGINDALQQTTTVKRPLDEP